MTDPKTILLCPGQGAQHVGMGRAWADASDAAAATFREADEQLGFDLSTLCFQGPEERVHRTDVSQPAIYVASVACSRALIERGELDEGRVAAAAGLSLGEYTALHLAGVFDFATGLRLVARRGRFMQEAAEASDSSMLALIGADEAQAKELCGAAQGEGVLVPANFNCPGQIVLSGSKDACERAVAEAERRDLRAKPLTVAGAFHSPLMRPAADRMAEELEQTPIVAPRFPVLSNVTGQPHGDAADEIKKRLVEQIIRPVRWEDNVRWLLENVEGEYAELAPGKVLRGLMRRIDRKTKVANHAEP